MRTVKLADKHGNLCGCEYTTDKRGREQWSKFCEPHALEHDRMHAAAVASCSQQNRDLTEELN